MSDDKVGGYRGGKPATEVGPPKGWEPVVYPTHAACLDELYQLRALLHALVDGPWTPERRRQIDALKRTDWWRHASASVR